MPPGEVPNFQCQKVLTYEPATSIENVGGVLCLYRAGWDGSEVNVRYVKGTGDVLANDDSILASFGPIALPFP